MKRWFSIGLFLFLLVLTSAATPNVNKLDWKHNDNQVSADIQSWNLKVLLERISSVTGWEVLLEPGTTRDISVKFSNLSIENALPRLFGKLNYALVPQTNAAPKFFVFKTSMGRATEAVRQSFKETENKDKNRIRTQLIVTLSPSSALTIDELAKLLGAKVMGRADGLHTYLLEFENESDALAARAKLNDNPNISSTENNYRFDPPPPHFAAPGSSSSAFNLKPVSTADANNPIVALVDSRVQNLDPAKAQFLLPGVSLVDGTPAPGQLTHGTSMADALLTGMAAGLKGAESSPWKILPIDIYGPNETTTTFNVAQGIYEAVNRGATIVNLSLGSPSDSPLLRSVIQSSTEQKVVFFGAAGNVPTDAPTYPAAYPEVMAVTAGDQNRNIAPYANYGSFVDVMGPGGTIVNYSGQRYFVGGTSVATAYVSGLAAGAATTTAMPLFDIQTLIRDRLGFTATPR